MRLYTGSNVEKEYSNEYVNSSKRREKINYKIWKEHLPSEQKFEFIDGKPLDQEGFEKLLLALVYIHGLERLESFYQMNQKIFYGSC